MAAKKTKPCPQHILIVHHVAEKGRVNIFCGFCGWRRWVKAPPCDAKKQYNVFSALKSGDYYKAIEVLNSGR